MYGALLKVAQLWYDFNWTETLRASILNYVSFNRSLLKVFSSISCFGFNSPNLWCNMPVSRQSQLPSGTWPRGSRRWLWELLVWEVLMVCRIGDICKCVIEVQKPLTWRYISLLFMWYELGNANKLWYHSGTDNDYKITCIIFKWG